MSVVHQQISKVVLLLLFASIPSLANCQANDLSNRKDYSRKIALLVGTGKYQAGRGKGSFRDLPAVANDLKEMAAALGGIGFETKIFSDLETPNGSTQSFRSPLVAGEASGVPVNSLHIARIVEQVLDSLDRSSERALLLIYFTGHGGTFGKSERVVALPDSEPTSPDSFYRLRKLLNLLADRALTADKYLVVDACADALGKRSDDLVTRTDEELPPYLFSSRLGEPSFVDPDKNESVFTLHFVDAIVRARELSLLDSAGVLDTDAIRAYLYSKVPAHGKIEQKRRPGITVSPITQHPYGSTQNLSLAVMEDTVPAPSGQAGRDEIDRYTRALYRGHYQK